MRPQVVKTQRLYLPLPLAHLRDLMVSYCEAEFDRRGKCEPTWLIQAPGWLVWIETRWDNEVDKIASTEAISGFLRQFHAVSYSCAIEAYVGNYTPEEVKRPDFVSPSKRKERDEVLMIMSWQRGQEEPLFTRFLINAKPGRRSFLGPRVDEDDKAKWAGGMMNLFMTRSERYAATDAAVEGKV